MEYGEIKAVHVTCVAASYGLFVGRGLWMMLKPERLQQHWVRIVPHVVDTLLLISAAALAYLSHQYPGVDNWLTAKVLGLLCYIILGNVALKRGKTRQTRIAAWIAAQGVFAYIVLVALTRSPLVF
ncbi:MAG: SirB2 family protein [Betaproteobacteria bacterium]|nr:SirB2 family protein [Betaproteobacteria bacterium]MDE2622107.1 SirB2 family protein [Betaproteobacteria bacterium]